MRLAEQEKISPAMIAEFQRLTILDCVCDEHGNPLLSAEDWETVKRSNGKLIVSLWGEDQRAQLREGGRRGKRIRRSGFRRERVELAIAIGCWPGDVDRRALIEPDDVRDMLAYFREIRPPQGLRWKPCWPHCSRASSTPRGEGQRPVAIDDVLPWSEINRIRSKGTEELTVDEWRKAMRHTYG